MFRGETPADGPAGDTVSQPDGDDHTPTAITVVLGTVDGKVAFNV
jgi:hypothetical protein